MRFLLILALVALSAMRADAAVPKLPIESYRLENGLNVALCHDPTLARTTVCLAYHVGSKNERKGLTGFAHFFEHMMFRGTKNVPNYDKPLQETGAASNAFTSEDVTVYFETVANNYLQRALYLEAERMAWLHSALDQHKFDTEREVVKNERRQVMENVPYGLSEETIGAHVFPSGHPYQWSVIGSMQDLNLATLEDLRQFFFEFYHPANCSLVLVGGFDQAEARRWIKHYFGAIPAGEKIKPVAAPPINLKPRRIVQRDDVQFPRVYWTWPTVPETHADAPALDLLADILADGDASRLYQALVMEERLASSVNASSAVREIDGLFTIDGTAAPGRSIEEIELALTKQLDALRTNEFSAMELQRAQAKHEVAMLRGLTDATSRAIAIACGLTQFGDPHYYQKSFTDYAKVKPQDIQRVAAKYLKPERFVLVIEPAGLEEEESAAVLVEAPAVSPVPPKRHPRPMGADPGWEQLPGPASAREADLPQIKHEKLSNGLEVWILPWDSLPLVSVRLIVPAGFANDPPGKEGLANLTARVWPQGTEQLTSTEFTQLMDGLGVSLGVSLSPDSTELSFTSGTSQLDEILRQLGALVTAPRLDQVDIEREKDLMQSALVRGPDDPAWIASRVFPKLMYGEHRYGSPSSGYQTSVSKLTRDDVVTQYGTYFAPCGATLVVVGDVDPDALVATLEKAWQDWQGSVEPPSTADANVVGDPNTIYVVDKPGAVQSVLVAGRVWHDPDHSSYFPTRIGNRVLGRDFLSRINQNLRERNGFTYGAKSYFEFRRLGGGWLVRTAVRADATGAALRELVNELDGPLGDRPISEDELQVARQAELNEFPAWFETPDSMNYLLSELATGHLPQDFLTQFGTAVRAMQLQEVSDVMGELLGPQHRFFLVVGDQKQIVPQLEKAGFHHFKSLDTDGRPLKN